MYVYINWRESLNFQVEKKKDKMSEQLLKDEDDDKSIWDSISR